MLPHYISAVGLISSLISALRGVVSPLRCNLSGVENPAPAVIVFGGVSAAPVLLPGLALLDGA